MAYKVEYITILYSSDPNAQAYSFTLSSVPIDPEDVSLDPVGGPAQNYGTDFTVSGDVLTFPSDLNISGNYISDPYEVIHHCQELGKNDSGEVISNGDHMITFRVIYEA